MVTRVNKRGTNYLLSLLTPDDRARVLGRCDAAVVQSESNRIDPDWLGIKRVFVIPLASDDQLDASLVRRNDLDSRIRVLKRQAR